MAVSASNVIVAGTGGIYVAPEGTTLPANPTWSGTPEVGSLAAVGVSYTNLGYVSEEGVNFAMERETEEIMSWQSMDAVRVLTTSEPKTISFELLQFDTDAFVLAMQGGTVADGVYTPPAAGTSDVRVLVVEGEDAGYKFRFVFPRVQLQGSVEFNLQRADAIRLPLEFKVLSSTPAWKFQTTHPAWTDTAE